MPTWKTRVHVLCALNLNQAFLMLRVYVWLVAPLSSNELVRSFLVSINRCTPEYWMMQNDVNQVCFKDEAVSQMLMVLDSSWQGLMLNLSLYLSIRVRRLQGLEGWSFAEKLCRFVQTDRWSTSISFQGVLVQAFILKREQIVMCYFMCVCVSLFDWFHFVFFVCL